MSACDCAVSYMNHVWLFLWPLFSVILGIIFGTLFGLGITLMIFLVTLLRTPMHVYQMLKVVMTTQECFQGHWMVHGPLRVAVFCLVPVPHALFLIFVTLFAGTVGVLYYIGKTTKMFYTHDYRKTMQQVESNVKLEPKSHLMKYIRRCQDYMENDDQSYPTIGILKAVCAAGPGIALGILPLVPFVVAIMGVTLYRLPINIYKTMRIASFTVLLEWDLRILALVTLPLGHLVVFPFVVLVGAVLVALVQFVFSTCGNIYDGESPFHEWSWFRTGVEGYVEMHHDFVTAANAYDHPSGIPYGWRGNTYSLPVRILLEWQWKFLVCCFLALYGLPICTGGTALLSLAKFIPSCGCEWYKLTSERCCQQSSLAAILGTWPFYVAEIIFFPLGILLWFVGLTIVSPFWVYRLPSVYLEHYNQPKGSLFAALYEPIVILLETDELTGSQFCKGWRIFSACAGRDFHNPYIQPPPSYPSSSPHQDGKQNALSYWDRFVEECIMAAVELRRREWITHGSIVDVDPSVIQSIPAVAILQILVASVRHEQEPQQQEKNVENVIVWPNAAVHCGSRDQDREQHKDTPSNNTDEDLEDPHRLTEGDESKPNGDLVADATDQQPKQDTPGNDDEDLEDPQVFRKAHESSPPRNNLVVVCQTTDVLKLIRQGDGIAAQLWPLILEIKRLLHSADKSSSRNGRHRISSSKVEEPRGSWLTSEENTQRLTALLCANQAETPTALEQFLKTHDTTTKPTSVADQTTDPSSFFDEKTNNQIRTQINDLVLSILRVQPYQERMTRIFQHKYDNDDNDDQESTTSQEEQNALNTLQPPCMAPSESRTLDDDKDDNRSSVDGANDELSHDQSATETQSEEQKSSALNDGQEGAQHHGESDECIQSPPSIEGEVSNTDDVLECVEKGGIVSSPDAAERLVEEVARNESVGRASDGVIGEESSVDMGNSEQT